MGSSQSAPPDNNVLTVPDNVLAPPPEMSNEADEVTGRETDEGGVHTVNPTLAGASGGQLEAGQTGQKPLESSPAQWKPLGTSPSKSRQQPEAGIHMMGAMVSRHPLGSGAVTDPSFVMDSPDGLMMPPGSELAVGGNALPKDTHGYSGEKDELGQRHGDGVQIFPDGRRYSGQFEVNSFHGSAIMEWPDGHRFTGQYENNQKSGDGFFLWPDGRFYDGQWKVNQRHGHGQYIAAESYVGDYHEGFRHGDGVLSWPDGKRYAGQFYRGALHGSAVMSWPDGRQYLGQYVDNQKQGEGLFYWPDGRLYEGQWRKGCRHGASRFVDNSGEDNIGQWHKDRLVSSESASMPGVRDPFCEPPPSLITKKPGRFKQKLEGIAEGPEEGHSSYDARMAGAGAFSPEGKLELAAQDIVLQIDEEAPPASVNVKPEGVVTVNGVDLKFYELYELRNMSTEELREHANRLHGSFGHVSSPVPQHDNGLLGWVYEIQSRHLRPLLDAAVFEIDDPQYGKEGAAAETIEKLDKAGKLQIRKAKPQKEGQDGIRGKDYQDVDDPMHVAGREAWPDLDEEDNPNLEDVHASRYVEQAPKAPPSNRRRERPTRLGQNSDKQVK